MRQLGGWHRLWIAIATLYALLIAWGLAVQFPTESRIKSEWASAAVLAMKSYKSDYEHVSPKKLRRRLYPQLNDEEVIRRVRHYAAEQQAEALKETGNTRVVPLVSGLMADADQKYGPMLQSLSIKQAELVGFGFGLWVVPVIVLYALGWAFGWVARGFQPK